MRIGVIGAGAVGGTIAALLDRQGHDVEITARGDHLDAVARHGLRLSGAWGEHTAWLRAGRTLDLVPDLAFVTTKAQDAEDAIRADLRTLDGAPVVIVQNGLDGLGAAQRLLKDSPVLGALALFAASHVEPGRVEVTAAGDTYLGAADGAPADALELARKTLAEAVPTVVVPDFLGAQWTKLVVNQLNALPAATGLSVQETIAHAGLRRIVTRSMREAIRAGSASGVRFASMQGLTDGSLRLAASAPLALAESLPRSLAAKMGDVPNPGSTLQSVRRGRETEIDHLNGAVVRAAQRAGREAPVNAEIVDLVHEVERSGSFAAIEDVVARFRALR